MAWFQTDDQFTNNKKPRELAERALEGHLDGLAALGLWNLSGSQCQASGTDGVIKRTDAIRLVLNAEIVDHLAGLLVGVRLWHAPGHDCPRCPDVAAGTWLFHDWFDIKYDRAADKAIADRKKAELKDAKILQQVWARDCTDPAFPNIGNCRYCGIVVKRKDNRSTDGTRPFIDHVDPTVADGVRNLVLACSTCNQRKGNRTPMEAGLKLLDPPSRPEPATASPVSPQRAAAGTVSPGTPDAETVSPGTPDAETVSPTPSDAGTPEAATDHTPTTPRPQTRPDENQTLGAVPARATRAGTGLAGSGQGKGLGRGPGKGSGTGSPAEPHDGEIPRKRRRRRGRGKSTSQPQPTQPTPTNTSTDRDPLLDAGAAPDVKVPARFGSPWKGWSGRPSTVDETTCLTHGIEQPCWKCARGGANS
ncbi:MAG: HNH endonuclease domain-containing protein [Rhodococcus sp. (in: high G+C Gram-positive bacteria)]|uniref:HNH endonuclease n=1 Tax=Rhodococcus sp. TaxID=1831 RepID=UPI002AD715C6|nr:HNH endonuclease domain-containing protein [Rhodococcus sp. (in: high G+C Gram-positive bacteria)]